MEGAMYRTDTGPLSQIASSPLFSFKIIGKYSNLLYLPLIKITQNIEFKSSFIKSPYKITRLNNLVDFRYYGY